MIRFLLKLIICALLAIGAGVAYLAMRSGDTVYTVHEWVSPQRFQQYDQLIRTVAEEHRIDPMLVKAVIWRESRFDPMKFGGAGERGLMQLTEGAAKEWAQDSRIADFRVEELMDPKVNVQAGTWYLARAMKRWSKQSDPVPFALAEYNAGASRAQRWAGGDDIVIPPNTFRDNIDFPGTRKYVDQIMARRDFYKRRGRM
ncbi:MAG: lytic transglycosylase domain-containing protein [Chthoniobacterales bacterium]|nr:lytic transglycosylase domain-containing protein [Chthoniobacterales bacterium]